MSAEILAAASIAMMALGSIAILAVMVGLTYQLIREGWLTRSVRVPAQKPTASNSTQPISTARSAA